MKMVIVGSLCPKNLKLAEGLVDPETDLAAQITASKAGSQKLVGCRQIKLFIVVYFIFRRIMLNERNLF